MKAELEDLLDEADRVITHPHRNPANLCDIFEEVIDLTGYGDSKNVVEYRYRLMKIAELMADAMLLGDIRYEGRMEMLEALNRNGFWKCPECGWVGVYWWSGFPYPSPQPEAPIDCGCCSGCGRMIQKIHGVWREMADAEPTR